MKKLRIRGIATIEFVLGFITFWFMIMAWAELSHISYVSAITDSIVTEAARESKTQQRDYASIFENKLRENESIWAGTVDPLKFRLSVDYFESRSLLSNAKSLCTIPRGISRTQCGKSNNKALAIYRLEYEGTYSLTSLFDLPFLLSREIIVVQEYEREAFKI